MPLPSGPFGARPPLRGAGPGPRARGGLGAAGAAGRDPHAVLGVRPGASAKEVKRAFRRRALKVRAALASGRSRRQRDLTPLPAASCTPT